MHQATSNRVVCCFGETCESRRSDVTLKKEGGHKCPRCSEWICALCLALKFGVHIAQILLAANDESLGFIHQAHLGSAFANPFQFPAIFRGVIENGATYCRPQVDIDAHVGWYDIHVSSLNLHSPRMLDPTTHHPD